MSVVGVSVMEAATSAPPAGPAENLVVAAQAGDEAARTALAEELGNAAYRFALQLVGDAEEARDVAQDSLVRFFESLDRVDGQRSPIPWMFRIVRNRVLDLRRRRRVRRHQSLDDTSGPVMPPELVDTRANPHREFARDELRRRLWQALDCLKPAHREILVLRDYQDLSYAELSEVLGIPRGTVMSRLHAARRQLRDRLLEGGFRFEGMA